MNIDRIVLKLLDYIAGNITFGELPDPAQVEQAINKYQDMAGALDKMTKALKVITETPDLRTFLIINDPKALDQALAALKESP